jgi:hypothetical protein
MEITYLRKLDKYIHSLGIKNPGFSEKEIEFFEQRTGIQFPIAYREFLFIAGKSPQLFYAWETCFIDEQLQKEIIADMLRFPVKPDPFWAFLHYENASQLLYFHLNEKEDPAVYGFYDMRNDDDRPYLGKDFEIKKLHISFSSCVNHWLKLAKNEGEF